MKVKVEMRPVAEKLYQVPPSSGEQEMVRMEQCARVVLNEFLSPRNHECKDLRLRSRIKILVIKQCSMAKKSLNGHLVSSKVTRVCDVGQLLLQALHHVGHLEGNQET